MSDDEIIYTLVARESDVLAEYTHRSGNFPQITQTVLNKLPSKPEKKMMSYAHPKGDYTFHVLTEYSNENDSSIIYLAMASEQFNQTTAFRYLVDVKKEFESQFGNRLHNARAYAFDNDFKHTLTNLMNIVNDPNSYKYKSNTNSKIDEIFDEIGNAQGVVRNAIDKALERGDRIEILVEKSDQLNEQAMDFRNKSKKLKNKMWWNNIKWQIGIVVIVLILIYLILGFTCGFTFKNCK